MLMNPQVREKVGLGPAEIKAYSAASDYRAKSQQKLMTAKDPLNKDIIVLDTTFADKVLKALSPSNRLKLLGLAVQAAGVEALADKEVASKIGLTKSQAKTVSELLAEKKKKRLAFDEMVFKGLEYAKDEERDEVLKSYDAERKSLSASLKAIDDKVLAILTAAQLKKWRAL